VWPPPLNAEQRSYFRTAPPTTNVFGTLDPPFPFKKCSIRSYFFRLLKATCISQVLNMWTRHRNSRLSYCKVAQIYQFSTNTTAYAASFFSRSDSAVPFHISALGGYSCTNRPFGDKHAIYIRGGPSRTGGTLLWRQVVTDSNKG
jgi:hypothetical protein